MSATAADWQAIAEQHARQRDVAIAQRKGAAMRQQGVTRQCAIGRGLAWSGKARAVISGVHRVRCIPVRMHHATARPGWSGPGTAGSGSARLREARAVISGQRRRACACVSQCEQPEGSNP